MLKERWHYSVAVLVVAALIIWTLTIVYETASVDNDSALSTIIAIARWASTALALGTFISAAWEAINMVLAKMLIDRYRQEGEQRLIERLPEHLRKQVEQYRDKDKTSRRD